MKKAFAIAGLLKILFIINLFLIELYRTKLLAALSSTKVPWDLDLLKDMGLGFWIKIYMLLGIILGLIVFNILTINILSFKPCSRYSKFSYKIWFSRFIYLVEILGCLASFSIAIDIIQDTFFPAPTHWLTDTFKEMLGDKEHDAIYAYTQKLFAINSLVAVLASVLALVSFWSVRRENMVKCSTS